MKHYVKLQSAEDLKLEWFDPAIPHMSARFNEQTLEECQSTLYSCTGRCSYTLLFPQSASPRQ